MRMRYSASLTMCATQITTSATNLSENGQRCRRRGGATVRVLRGSSSSGSEGSDAIGEAEMTCSCAGTAQEPLLLVQVGNCRRESGRAIGTDASVAVEVAGVVAIDVHDAMAGWNEKYGTVMKKDGDLQIG